MANITIRKLDEVTTQRLRLRAAQHKRSIEDEAGHIVRTAPADQATISDNLAEAIHRRFAPLGGFDLRLPPREPPKPGK